MKKKLFFAVVIFFVFSLFVYFGLVRTRFVGLVTSPVSSVVLRSVQERNVPVVAVDIVNQNVGDVYQV